MRNSLYERLAKTIRQARVLADETRLLIRDARVSAHAARNARHHAGLVRVLGKIIRERA